MFSCKQQVPLSPSLSPFPPCVRHTHASGCSVWVEWVFLGGVFNISVLTFTVSLLDYLPLPQAKKEKNVFEFQPLNSFVGG